MQHSSIRAQELNPGRLTYLFRKQFELSKVQKGETIAIVSDLGTRREFIESAFAAADEFGAGGKRNTCGHYDVPMRDCTVTLDNQVIIDKGKLADPKMVVAREARG